MTRFDKSWAMSLFAGGAGWIQSQDATQGVTTFTSGPWISSVVPDVASGGLLHVYAPGFGTTLETHLASAPEGPWSPSSSLGPCQLPPGDTHAFCAGPVVHPELADPSRPGEVVVSYGVGTMAQDQAQLLQASPADYWTRLVWTAAP